MERIERHIEFEQKEDGLWLADILATGASAYGKSKQDAETNVIAIAEAVELAEGMERKKRRVDLLFTTFAWVVLILAGLWLLHTLAQAAASYPEWKGLIQ